MSKYKITLEHESDNGEEARIVVSGVCSDTDVLPIFGQIAQDIARALASLDKLGKIPVCEGKEILEEFEDVLREEWGQWEDEAILRGQS